MSLTLQKFSTFAFTDYSFKSLADRGFDLTSISSSTSPLEESSGVSLQTLTFDNNKSLEWIDIEDDELFLKSPAFAQFRTRLCPYISISADKAPQSLFKLEGIPLVPCIKSQDAKKASHPNTCTQIIGAYISIADGSFSAFADSLELKVDKNKLRLADQSLLIRANQDDEAFGHFRIHKEFPLWAVILKCQSFETFKALAKPDLIFNFQGRQAGLIKENPSSWDIIVVENQP